MEEKGMAPVGAYRLAYTRMGSGSPVVVLESAGGAPRTNWDTVMPAIAGFTQVISYDRGGLGESERAGRLRTLRRPRTLPDLARDLKALLDYLQTPGPYILVGNSIGGLIVRYFAYQHPDQVAGLVLMDSSHPDLYPRQLALLPAPTPDEGDQLKGMRSWLTNGYVDDPEHDSQAIDFFTCGDQARNLPGLGDLPLVVIAAGNHKLDGEDTSGIPASFTMAFEQMWYELQEDLSRLSTRGRYIIAQNSGHFIHRYEPDLVVSIIKEMVEEYRAEENGRESTSFSPANP